MITLDDIIEHKKHKLERLQEAVSLSELEKKALPVKNRGFKAAISRGNRMNLIAEIKKASPSHGILRYDFDPVSIASVYKASGASAISVLTEDKYFQGSLEILSNVRDAVKIPVMRKDFIISEYQIYESAVAGADAVLLIATALDRGMLKALLHEASSLGMDSMVEVHDERDLDKAVGAGAEIIGINNRNLKTMEVDLTATAELMPKVPEGKITVSESGIREPEDIKSLSQYGVKAVLIGTAFMEADDIASEIKRVMDW